MKNGLLLFAVSSLAWTATADAGGGCGPSCQPAPCQPEVQYVEKTIYVPQMVSETRTVNVTKYRTEERERRYMVHRCVPETTQVEQKYIVMVPQQKERTVEYTVNVPVTRDVEQKYWVCVPKYEDVEKSYQVKVPVWDEVEKTCTVLVPHREQRQGTRTVCKVVPVKEKRTVTCDRGHWEVQTSEVACGKCLSGCAPRVYRVCKRVWVPNVVTEEVEVTVCRRQTEEVPYEYCVTVMKPEQRSYTQKVCNWKTETRTRTVRICKTEREQRTRTIQVRECKTEQRTRTEKYTVCVPETRTRTVNVTNYKQVSEEGVQKYNVCVPYTETKEVEVQVCKMVPKTITVPVCESCNSCRPRGLFGRMFCRF